MDELHYRFTFEASCTEERSPTSVAESLAESPFSQSSKKSLVLTSLGLRSIGQLNTSAYLLQQVDLSQNQLSSLEGLEVLKNLRSLFLNNNQVKLLQATEPLRGLVLLSVLDLSGNPVTAKKAYRPYTVSSLKSLETLDKHPVTAKQRAANLRLTQQAEELALELMDSEQECTKLEHLLRTLRVHRQLIIEKALVAYTPVDVSQFRQFVRFDWDPDLFDELFELVINRLNSNRLESWWTQVIRHQEEKLEDTLAQCETLAYECSCLFSRCNTPFYTETFCSETSRATSPSRVESLGDCFSHFVRRDDDTKAIYSAIRTGLEAVVSRFKRQKVLKRVFQALKTATSRAREIGSRVNEFVHSRNEDLLRKILKNWRTYKTQAKQASVNALKLMQYLASQRKTKTKLKVFYQLKTFAQASVRRKASGKPLPSNRSLQSYRSNAAQLSVRGSQHYTSSNSTQHSFLSKATQHSFINKATQPSFLNKATQHSPARQPLSSRSSAAYQSTSHYPTHRGHTNSSMCSSPTAYRGTPRGVSPHQESLWYREAPPYRSNTPTRVHPSLYSERRAVSRHNSARLIQDVFDRLNSLEAKLNSHSRYY